jgi:gamma-glutamylcysteine synthetase
MMKTIIHFALGFLLIHLAIAGPASDEWALGRRACLQFRRQSDQYVPYAESLPQSILGPENADDTDMCAA